MILIPGNSREVAHVDDWEPPQGELESLVRMIAMWLESPNIWTTICFFVCSDNVMRKTLFGMSHVTFL